MKQENTGNAAGQSNNAGDQQRATHSSQPTQEGNNQGNTIKDPDNWTTGEEPMTGAQHSYLSTLSQEAREPVDENLTKANASKKIEELQQKTGRGLDTNK